MQGGLAYGRPAWVPLLDGQELVNQQQAYGDSILMNAIFRPLLTLVGLVSVA